MDPIIREDLTDSLIGSSSVYVRVESFPPNSRGIQVPAIPVFSHETETVFLVVVNLVNLV